MGHTPPNPCHSLVESSPLCRQTRRLGLGRDSSNSKTFWRPSALAWRPWDRRFITPLRSTQSIFEEQEQWPEKLTCQCCCYGRRRRGGARTRLIGLIGPRAPIAPGSRPRNVCLTARMPTTPAVAATHAQPDFGPRFLQQLPSSASTGEMGAMIGFVAVQALGAPANKFLSRH